MRTLIACLALAALPLLALAQSSPFTGTWAFTFSGNDSGSGTAVVGSSGQITGRGSSRAAGAGVDVSGTVTADGHVSFKGIPSGNTSLASTFVGTADPASGKASGSWTNPGAKMQGVWTASRSGKAAESLATGLHCAGDPGMSKQDAWDAADVSALYLAKNGAVYLTALKRTEGEGLDNWVLTVHALDVTGPGAFDIIDKPGRRSTLTYRPAGASSADKQYAKGTLNVTRLGGGSLAGSLDMKGGTLSVHCSFDIPISGTP